MKHKQSEELFNIIKDIIFEYNTQLYRLTDNCIDDLISEIHILGSFYMITIYKPIILNKDGHYIEFTINQEQLTIYKRRFTIDLLKDLIWIP